MEIMQQKEERGQQCVCVVKGQMSHFGHPLVLHLSVPSPVDGCVIDVTDEQIAVDKSI